MKQFATLFSAVLLVSVLASGSALARGAGGGRPHVPRPEGGGTVVVSDPQEPVAWMTNYDEACKLASDENRALLILISTEAIDRAGQTCSFAANSLRKAVRESKVVPLKLLPPVMLDTDKLSAEEVKQRQEAFKKAQQRYESLAKGFGVQTVPSIVYAAPDAAKLTIQATPADAEIMGALARLPEMVKAHNEAVAKAGADKKPDPAVAVKDPGKQPDPKPPEEKPAPTPKPGNPADDF
jgi:thioredoxin-related protein